MKKRKKYLSEPQKRPKNHVFSVGMRLFEPKPKNLGFKLVLCASTYSKSSISEQFLQGRPCRPVAKILKRGSQGLSCRRSRNQKCTFLSAQHFFQLNLVFQFVCHLKISCYFSKMLFLYYYFIQSSLREGVKNLLFTKEV